MNIFEELGEKKSIFKCKKYLDHRFLPDYLPHRDDQIKSVAKYWIEALGNVTPPDVTIYGKTGTGKTAAGGNGNAAASTAAADTAETTASTVETSGAAAAGNAASAPANAETQNGGGV